MPLKTHHRKVKGEWAEIAFLSKAHRLGFIVSRPWGDSAPYDFVIEGKRRRLYRIQVKSIWTKHSNRYTLNLRASLSRLYLPGDIDFLVGFIVPERTWYVIPVRALGRRRGAHVYPHRPNSRGIFEQFRDNWRLLQ